MLLLLTVVQPPPPLAQSSALETCESLQWHRYGMKPGNWHSLWHITFPSALSNWEEFFETKYMFFELQFGVSYVCCNSYAFLCHFCS